MIDIKATLTRARDALADCSAKLLHAYRHVGSVTADHVNGSLLPDIDALLPNLDAAIAAAGWRPIDTAPKDGMIQLNRDGVYDVGHWDDDRYAKKPRPLWRGDLKHYRGPLWMRKNPPTHWMPLPAPPATAPTVSGGDNG